MNGVKYLLLNLGLCITKPNKISAMETKIKMIKKTYRY